MSINVLLDRLVKVKSHGENKWLACCSAHPDKTPSLAIQELNDGRILIHCFAGCAPSDIMTAVGLSMSDLFPEGLKGEFKGWEQLKKKAGPQERIDKLTLEIAAQQRAEGKKLSPQNLEIEREAYKRLHK